MSRRLSGGAAHPSDRSVRPGRGRGARAGLGAGCGLVVLLALAGCAGVPEPAAAPEPSATTAPAVLTDQAERVRGEVADRLLAARVAGDAAILDAAATGPAALLDGLRLRVDGPLPDATAEQPVPAAVLVAPRGSGWPRWFATVTDPSTAPQPAPSTEPSTAPSTAPGATAPGAPAPGAAPSGEAVAPSGAPADGAPVDGTAVVQELPVLELYTSDEVRLPYRLWARLTLLPGAEVPAFPAAELGAVSLAGGTAPEPVPSGGASTGAEDEADDAAGGSAADDEAAADDAGLLAAVTGLASRYASVMSDGDASPSAAEFEPDPFVEAVRSRAAAEAAAVAGIADVAVENGPLDGVEVLYAARAADGSLLAVTAVETTVTTTVRGGGVLRPGTELRAASGIEETGRGLTTRSVAALAFVVPAEQGAIRLVAVCEGLVSAGEP